MVDDIVDLYVVLDGHLGQRLLRAVARKLGRVCARLRHVAVLKASRAAVALGTHKTAHVRRAVLQAQGSLGECHLLIVRRTLERVLVHVCG